MCGIAGWINFQQDLSESAGLMQQMGDLLACRGPDRGSWWTAPHAAFAHRRLIVVDPAGGAQPMHWASGTRRLTMVYNGELYNTEELRRLLEASGHTFRGWSDTEVLLTAYAEWGPDCLDRLNGIFAFAVWDDSRRELFAARDRMGVKPFFFCRRGSHMIFASELKAILAHPAVPHELDESGVNELLVVGPGRTPGQGLFRGVRELRPGHALLLNPQGLREWRYWQLRSAPHEDTLPRTIETVRALFRDAVTRQLVADVPVATFLSGGLDSSAVTAVAAAVFQARHRPLHTYSVEFQDQAQYFQANAFQHSLDTPWARRVASHVGSRHHEVVLDTQVLGDLMERALIARDHPGMADIDISLLAFCEHIRKNFVVALSGEAADEVFGGYPWCHRPDALGADTFPWARRLSDRIALMHPDLQERLHPREYVQDRYQEALNEVPRLPAETGPARRIREVLYLNQTRFLATLLDRKDRMSMAVGLEVRVPFCDHRLVEYVWNIPWEWKTLAGEPKGILRAAVSADLPADVVSRPKSPYPTTHHPQFPSFFRKRLIAALDDPSSPLHSLIDTEAVRRLTILEPSTSDLPWYGQMMGLPALFCYLVQTDLWFRHYAIRLAL